MPRPRLRPALEQLEDRLTPALYGVPWPDPSHLTLSFVPDGTDVGGSPSVLFQKLNAQAPFSWQGSTFDLERSSGGLFDRFIGAQQGRLRHR